MSTCVQNDFSICVLFNSFCVEKWCHATRLNTLYEMPCTFKRTFVCNIACCFYEKKTNHICTEVHFYTRSNVMVLYVCACVTLRHLRYWKTPKIRGKERKKRNVTYVIRASRTSVCCWVCRSAAFVTLCHSILRCSDSYWDHNEGKTSGRLLLSRWYVFVNNFGKTRTPRTSSRRRVFIRTRVILCKRVTRFPPERRGLPRRRGSKIYVPASVRKRMIRDAHA